MKVVSPPDTPTLQTDILLPVKFIIFHLVYMGWHLCSLCCIYEKKWSEYDV